MVSNQNWQTANGEPITGRTPPRVIVMGEHPLRPTTTGHISRVYEQFAKAVKLSIAPAMSRDVVVPDGSLIRMVSRFGIDTIRVWPAYLGKLGPFHRAVGFLATLFGLPKVRPPRGIGVCLTDAITGLYPEYSMLASLPGAPEVYAPQPLVLAPKTVDDRLAYPTVTTGEWEVIRVGFLKGGNRAWGSLDGKRSVSIGERDYSYGASYNVNDSWTPIAMYGKEAYWGNQVRAFGATVGGVPFFPAPLNYPEHDDPDLEYLDPLAPLVGTPVKRRAMLRAVPASGGLDFEVYWLTYSALSDSWELSAEVVGFSSYYHLTQPSGTILANFTPSPSGASGIVTVITDDGSYMATVTFAGTITLAATAVAANTSGGTGGADTPSTYIERYDQTVMTGSYPLGVAAGSPVYDEMDTLIGHAAVVVYGQRSFLDRTDTSTATNGETFTASNNLFSRQYHLRDGSVFTERTTSTSSGSSTYSYSRVIQTGVESGTGSSAGTPSDAIWYIDGESPSIIESAYVAPTPTFEGLTTCSFSSAYGSINSLTHAGGTTVTDAVSNDYTVSLSSTNQFPTNDEVNVSGSFSRTSRSLIYMDTTTGDAIWAVDIASASADGVDSYTSGSSQIVFIGRAGTVTLVNDLPPSDLYLSASIVQSGVTYGSTRGVMDKSSWVWLSSDRGDWITAQEVASGYNELITIPAWLAAHSPGDPGYTDAVNRLAELIEVPHPTHIPSGSSSYTETDTTKQSTAETSLDPSSGVFARYYSIQGDSASSYLYAQAAKDPLTHAAVVHVRFDRAGFDGGADRSWVFVMDDTGCRPIQAVIGLEGGNPEIWSEYNTSSLVTI